MPRQPRPSRSAALAALDTLHAEATAAIRARAKAIRADDAALLKRAAKARRVLSAALAEVDWRKR